MISRLSGSVSCSLRISSLRRKAGGRVQARDEWRDIDRRRAATGLARARARPAPSKRSCWAWAWPAQWSGAGAAGLAPRARAARRWAWERAMIVRVIARGQANGSADEYLCARASSWGESAQKERAPLTSLIRLV